MIETIIGALVAFALVICACALVFPAGGGLMTDREELLALISSLPEDAKIYITIEKDRTDTYGACND